MAVIQYLLSFLLYIIIVLSFINIKWSIAIFLMYFILVPGFNIGFEGLGSGENLMFLVLFLLYFIYSMQNNYKFFFYELSPFIWLFVFMIIVMPCQDMSIGDNFFFGIKNALNSLLLPLILLNIIKNDKSSIILYKKIIIVCFIIVLMYGLFQITLGGGNPYTLFMTNLFHIEKDFESYYAAEDQGRIFGRISSVFLHPMNFAFFLGCSIVYWFYIKEYINKYIFFIILFLALVLAVLCGVRSLLGALCIALTCYLFFAKNYRVVVYVIIGVYVFYSITSYFGDLKMYLLSIFDTQGGNVSGSSIDLRIRQLNGALDIMSNNPLFGLGANYTTYYLTIHGDHPVCLAFESLVYIVLCNSGIIGVFMWIRMIYKYFCINKGIYIKHIDIANTLMCYYISYSIITGEYGYMKYFLLFYVLMLGESYLQTSNKNCNYVKTKSNSVLFAPISSNS